MAAPASLWVKLGLTDSDFVKGLKQAENRLNKFGQRLSALGSRLTVGLSIPLAVASGAAIKFGMDAVESESLFTVSMGKMTDAARQWSKELRKNLGLNEYELRRSVGLFQTMGTAMGLTEDAAFSMGKGITELGHDMASFFNVASDQALNDLKAIFTGEAEPLKKYGIVLLETNVKQWALTNGLIKQGEEMSQAQKVFARYNLVLEQTKNAQGDLARTLDSPANKLRILQEQLKMAATEAGVALLPAFTSLLQALTPLVKKIGEAATWFNNLPAPIKNTAAALLGVSIAIGPVLLGIGKMVSGWSALIGILRMLPTLGINKFFADIGIYIGGAIKGAWSLKEAMTALSASFAPFLIGGAIIAGIVVLVDFFKKLAENARIAKLEISSISETSDAEKKRQQIQAEITRLENMKKAASSPNRPEVGKWNPGYDRNSFAYGGIGSFTDAEQAKLDKLKNQLKELDLKINELKNPVQSAANETANFQAEFQKMLDQIKGTGEKDAENTVLKAMQEYGKVLDIISEKEKLKIPDYDAQKERYDALQAALDAAITSTDADSKNSQIVINMLATALQNLMSEIDASIERQKAYNEAILQYIPDTTSEAYRAAHPLGNTYDNSLPAAAKLDDYLDATADAFSGIQGPLADFAQGLVDAISKTKTLEKNIGALNPESLQSASQGPMGAFGGFMQALGAIGSIMSILGGVLSQLLGLDKVAEQQQKAAEAWMRFLKEASVSQMFGKREELEAKLIEYRKQLAEAQKIGGVAGIALREFWGKKIEEILKQLEQIPEAAQQLLGVTIQDLSSAISSAFSAADLTEFKNKFKESFTETMRQAMINAWMSEQALKPLQEAIMKAFDPASVGGTTVTSEELKKIKTLWDSIGTKGSSFYELLDKLGLGMGELEKATTSATSAMLNVPEGLKVERYRYAAANPQIIATAASSPVAPTASTATQPQEITVNQYLDTGALVGSVKLKIERDNVVSGGTVITTAPAFVGA